MDIKDRFLNFPIVLLKGFLDNHKECLDNIFFYAVFEMVFSEKAKFKSIGEFQNEFEFYFDSDLITEIQKHGKGLFDLYNGVKCARTGLHFNSFVDFRKPKKEFDLVCLLLFLALKSIVQTKPYANAKDALILSRMAGYSKVESDIPENIAYWMKTGSRRRPKVFNELEKYFKLVKANSARGTTFSINKLTQEQLEFTILQKGDQKSDREMNEKKRKAKEEAKRRFEEWRKGKKGDSENNNQN
jgi:hypothetical protein